MLVLPYLHPMPLARQLATIDVMSGGRLDVGVGVGLDAEENEALGIDYHTRGAVGDECIDVMKAAVGGRGRLLPLERTSPSRTPSPRRSHSSGRTRRC